MCYSFYNTYKNKPKSYYEIFEFCKLKELEGIFEDYIKSLRKAQND